MVDDVMFFLVFILMVLIALVLAVGFHVKLAPVDYDDFGVILGGALL